MREAQRVAAQEHAENEDAAARVRAAVLAR
jgi:hypothetical protein